MTTRNDNYANDRAESGRAGPRIEAPLSMKGLALRLRTLSGRRDVRRYALIVAALGFVAGLALSLQNIPANTRLQPEFLALIVILGAPLAILANTLETRLNARLAGGHFTWAFAFRVAILSSAANLLPLPGGAIVRLAALRGVGVPLVKGSATTVLIAAIWLGLALLIAGLPLGPRHAAIAFAVTIAGGVIVVASAIAMQRICRSIRLVAAVIVLKLGAILVGIIRMLWALGALNASLSLIDASIFALSSVAGSAVSIVPAGLGVTEGVAALLAPVHDIPASTAFLAVTLNRIVALAVTCFVAVALVAFGSERRD